MQRFFHILGPIFGMGIAVLLYLSMGCGDDPGPDAWKSEGSPSSLEIPSEADDDLYTDATKDGFSDNPNYRYVGGTPPSWDLDVLRNDTAGKDYNGTSFQKLLTALSGHLDGNASIVISNNMIRYTLPKLAETEFTDTFTYTVHFTIEGEPDKTRIETATVTVDPDTLNPTQVSFPAAIDRENSALSAPSIISGISAFSSQTINPGESTSPIVFSITHSNRSIDLSSLMIEAVSSDSGVIDDDNIEIVPTDPGHYSLIARHEGVQTGATRIKVTVRDPYGVGSSASFLVTVQDASTN